MRLVRRGIKVLREDGILELLRKSVSFVRQRYLSVINIYTGVLRPLLPPTGNQRLNSVIVRKSKPLDDHFGVYGDNPRYESGIASCHESLTQPGDEVVVVGGGKGVTGVIAAEIVGSSGSVTIYEGSSELVKYINNVVALNDVTERCTVNHAIVGSDKSVSGVTLSSDIIRTGEIPDCDVLELDCEGSEIDILPEITCTPRVIIVEIHPWNFSENPEAVIDALSDRGYRVTHRYGHDGTSLSENEFYTLLSNSTVRREKDVESGGRWPVVIAAVQESDR